MSEEPNAPTNSRWPKHLAQRRWYGWVIAALYGIIFIFAEIGQFSAYLDASATQPESVWFLAFSVLLTAIIFYGLYWFFMFRIYYATKDLDGWVMYLISFINFSSIFK
jgi:hypothetical protein